MKLANRFIIGIVIALVGAGCSSQKTGRGGSTELQVLKEKQGAGILDDNGSRFFRSFRENSKDNPTAPVAMLMSKAAPELSPVFRGAGGDGSETRSHEYVLPPGSHVTQKMVLRIHDGLVAMIEDAGGRIHGKSYTADGLPYNKARGLEVKIYAIRIRYELGSAQGILQLDLVHWPGTDGSGYLAFRLDEFHYLESNNSVENFAP